ncbi:MAG: NlpC/P60 family protein [Xanthobacteraceae bacterium]
MADANLGAAALHWAVPLIGKPYRARARGPDAFCCWGLNQYVWRQRLGIDVPDIPDAADAFRRIARDGRYAVGRIAAVEAPAPRELDAVYMTMRKAPHHVGVWVAADGGGVLHALDGAGVVFQRRADLTAHGITIVKFMRLDIG